MLKLEDLKVGMRVSVSELANIFYKLIILTDFDKDNKGKIVYIGEPNTSESTNLYNSLEEICTVYNVDESEVSWDE